MQNYYYQPNINDTYLNRLQRLNQLQNQFNNQSTSAFSLNPYTNPLPLNNQIIFVQGETGAKAYQIPNNTTVLLMSSESNEFFIKATDSSGFPTIRKFTFQEHPNQDINFWLQNLRLDKNDSNDKYLYFDPVYIEK